MIHIKRVYTSREKTDGVRFLVDHLWPRGIKKQDPRAEHWLKEMAPSTELRRWFGHDPARWAEFRRRYFAELKAKPAGWKPLLEAARVGDITLVYSAKDTEHNNALALREFLEAQLHHSVRQGGNHPISRTPRNK
jgi:uncharacterized protein YeaO (DUF488 family)